MLENEKDILLGEGVGRLLALFGLSRCLVYCLNEQRAVGIQESSLISKVASKV